MLLIALLLTVLEPEPRGLLSQPTASRADEFADRLKAGRGDVKALWELANWCEARGMLKERDRALKSLLRTSPDDKKARELLGHTRFDKQWFTSEKKLKSYKKKKARADKARREREAKDKGWVRYKGDWVDPQDVPFLERGWVRTEAGLWITPEERERLEQGWIRQDLEWIDPESKAKIEADLWKCDEDWLDLQRANVYHAQLDHWWRIPGQHFVVWSTCGRELAKKSLKIADDTYRDMQRLFGRAPIEAPAVLVLRNLNQYTDFSKDGIGGGGKSLQGHDSLRGAYFPDLWLDDDGEFVGVGVAYWSTASQSEDRWGSLWVRHAAAHSFIEALDPSPEARAALLEEGGGEAFVRGFWEQKLIPAWLRFGAASYAERYFIDPSPNDGNDSLWARRWSAGEVAKKGGLDSLDELFEFRFSMDDTDKALHLLNQVGLLVAFILDGDSPAMTSELSKFHQAMRLLAKDSKKGPAALEKSIRGIERALKKNKKQLAAFAGF